MRRITGVFAAVLLAAGLLAAEAPAAAASARPEPVPGMRLAGNDVSWPNCPKGLGIPSRRSEGKPMPTATAAFALLGLTNGPGFFPNPCLAGQVAWVQARGLWVGAYAMTTYPTKAQRALYGGAGPWPADQPAGQLRNTGYQQALFNVTTMKAAGLEVPMVWVDVEPYAVRPWSRSTAANRDVIRGAVRGYEDSGYRVGFYSYDLGWRTVVGAWRKPAYPAWVPVGRERRGATLAAVRCGLASFSRGEPLLAQWVRGDRDHDLTCPALHGRVAGRHELTPYVGLRLRRGAHGASVVALQRALGLRPGQVDGYFGLRTRRALKAFQRAHGLPASGVTRARSWRALGAGTWVPERPSRLAEIFSVGSVAGPIGL
jgi:hypothetical protein